MLCWGLKNRNKSAASQLRCCKRSKPFSISLITSAAPADTTAPTEPATGLESEQGTRNFQCWGLSLSHSVSRRTQHTHAERGRAPPQFSREGGSAIGSPQIGPTPRAAGVEGQSAEQIFHTRGRRASPFRNARPGRRYPGHHRAAAPSPPALTPSCPPPPPGPTAARPLCARPPPKPRRLLQPAINVKPAHLARPLLPTGPLPQARSVSRRAPPSRAFPQVPACPRPAPWRPGGACAEGQVRCASPLRVEVEN